MTNFEKYKNEIMKIVTENCCSPAKKDGVVVACAELDCKECDFGDASKCRKNYFDWLCEDDGEEPDCCNGCKCECKAEYESPCTKCRNNYTSKFECKPRKTRQDEFLERYPNAKKCKDILKVCPAEVDIDYKACETYSECSDCRRDYWLQEVEE